MNIPQDKLFTVIYSLIKRKQPLWTLLAAIIIIVAGVLVSTDYEQQAQIKAVEKITLAQTNQQQSTLIQNYAQLALRFEQNQGQTNDSIHYISRGTGYTLYLTDSTTVITLSNPEDQTKPGTTITSQLVGADLPLAFQGQKELPGKVNYLMGQDASDWITNIPGYAEVIAKQVYPGIDLLYHSDQEQLEYDFIVAPGARTDTIKLRFQGLKQLALNDAGDLLLDTGHGILHHKKPIIYQVINGERIHIDGHYTLHSSSNKPEPADKQNIEPEITDVGFVIAAYDSTHSLIIDPVLDYSTYLGGNADDQGLAIAVDSSGSAYVAGTTLSTTFPTVNPYQNTLYGSRDAFIAKLNPAGNELVYATYLGGSGDQSETNDGQSEEENDDDDDNDQGIDIAVDSSGHLYITGTTNSASDFPIVNAFQTTYGGGISDAYIAKLSPDGSNLLFSSYLGGNRIDKAYGITLDTVADIYLTGMTRSTNLPVLNAIQTNKGGAKDAYIAKLSSDGSSISYLTYFGGSQSDSGKAIAVDSQGNASITGFTRSDNDFPLENALQTTFGGERDAFISQLSNNGSVIHYSSYLGGSEKDNGFGIVIDSQDNILVVGKTQSNSDFPLVNALQSTYGGGNIDGFISKLSSTTHNLLFSTYIGGEENDKIRNIAIDINDNLYVIGTTKSSTGIPTTEAIQSQLNGSKRDAFISQISHDGSSVIFGSYFGGSKNDKGRDIALNGQNIYITGISQSELNFPLQNAAQNIFGGGIEDAFIAKIAANNLAPQITSTPITSAIVGQLYQYQLTAEDADGDSLSYTLQTAPSGMTIDASSGLISWTANAPGNFNVVVEVNDGNAGTDTQAYVISVIVLDTTAPTITITNLPDGNITNQEQLTITGQLSEIATLTFNGVNVPVNPDSSFSIPITLPEGLNSFTLIATDIAGNVSSKIINITLDTVVPVLTVDTPEDNTLSTQPDILFSGSVSEPVTLTINAQTVITNPDNSFSTNFVLAEGLNNLTLIATDAAGNVHSVTLNITLDTLPPALNIGLVNRGNPQNQIVMIAGLPGAAEAGALVHVINPTNGFEARVLAQSDGSFSTEVSGFSNDSFQLFAVDAAGNQSASLSLSATTPLSLTLDSIGNKITPLGQTTRFTVTASDSADNPITLGLTPVPLPAGMEYNITTGEFSFKPTIGQEGAYSLTFSAFSGEEKITETVNLTVPTANPAEPTDFRGRVLDANSFTEGNLIPIVGATISFLGSNITATTDVDGYFILSGLLADAQLFDIDANTASLAPDGAAYASFREGLSLVQNVVNQEERPFFLPRIDASSVIQVNPAATTVVNNPDLKISLTIPPHTAKNPDGTDFTGQLSISEVPLALAPVALPEFIVPSLLITVQPVGVTFSSPVAITYPNLNNLDPGSQVDLFQVDRDLGEFVVIGIGQVSADGQRIETVSGGITASTWSCAHETSTSPNPLGPPVPDPNIPCPGCPPKDLTSKVSLNDGHMSTQFTLPAYRSLEASRALSFSYRTFRAYPRPTIEFNGLVGRGNIYPDTISYQVDVAGLRQGKEVFLSGFSSENNSFRTSISFNADDFASGMYDYRLITSNHFTVSTSSLFTEGKVMVVNESRSPFGAGWMLGGLYRLAFNLDDSVTLISPNGNSINYLATADPDVFASPDSDYATLVRDTEGQYTHTEKDGVKMLFDSEGLLSQRQDRNNNMTAYAYNAEGNLVSITDPVGLLTHFAYNNNGLLQTVTDPANRASTFDYDPLGNLIKITFPDDTFETFEYDARHLMIAHQDERQNRFTNRYDSFGKVIDGTLPDDTVRSAVGRSNQALVDTRSGIGSSSNPAPLTEPDAVNGNYLDGRANPSSKKLDSHGRTLLSIDEVGRTTEHIRDADSNATQTTRPIGSIVTRTFDSFGNVLSQKEEFNSATTSYSYDNFSLVTQVTNPRQHSTTINRDPVNGNPLSIINHLLHTTTMEYDDPAAIPAGVGGLVTKTTHPNGLVTTYTYNAQGLMDSKTETPPVASPGNVRLWSYNYFPSGLLQTVNTPDGITLTYSYDERSYLLSVSDNLNQTIVYDYDDHKNVIKTETSSSDGSLALLVESVYDNRNRLVETRAPHVQVNGETTEESITQRVLDENNNLIGMIDPNGNSSSNAYDPYNRLDNNTHREQGITTYQYDDQDRIIELSAPNEVSTEYEYDIINRKTKEISPDRGTITYDYDLANNVTTITEGRGITATMSYDELERVKIKTYPNTIAGKTEDVTYTYDNCLFGLGYLCERTDESGSYQYQYDAYGNMTTSSFTEIEGTFYATSYIYDDGDHLIQMSYPSGRVVDYSRDGVRRMQSIDTTVNGLAQNIVSNIQYRGDNQMLSCDFGNGLSDIRTYDLQGRLRSQQLNDTLNTAIDQRSYSYDKNSNVLNIDSNVEDNAYLYDKLDRLVSDSINTGLDDTLTYDLNDNRLGKTRFDLDQEDFLSYQDNSNKVIIIETLQAGTTPIANAVNRELIYNDVGRLFQLIEEGSLKAQYIYNDQGQRTRKTVFQSDGISVDSITIYHYDGMGYLITETTESGQLIKDYIWQQGMHPVAQIDNTMGTEQVLYLYTDHLMTNRLATDQNQSIIWRWEGEAFGDTPAQELAGFSVNLRFPGQYFDAETNLHYNYFRYYEMV